MKALIVALTLTTAFIASPVFAQSPNAVVIDGKVIGQDPDATVRLQIRRDYGSEGY